MELAIVTPQLKHYGGSEIYLLECVRRWQERAKITIYTVAINRRLFQEYGVDPTRVNVVLLPGDRSQGRFSLLHQTVTLPTLWERALKRHDAYFLYLYPTQLIRRNPSLWFCAEPLRMIYDLRYQSPTGGTTVEIHLYPKLSYERVHVAEHDVLLHLIEQFDTCQHVDRIATNSLATGRYLRTVYDRPADCVAYPGVLLPDETRPLPEERCALSIGRLWKHKRVDLAIQALSFLSEGSLAIVGEGPEKSTLTRLARSLGLKDRVRFLGKVRANALQDLYQSTYCCIYTPVREPFGMVPLEAAAAGRPVVGTKAGGYSEVLDDQSACFVPAVPEKIGEALQRLFEDPALATRMGQHGREQARACSWDRTADLLFAQLEEIREKPLRTTPIEDDPKLGAHYYPWYRADDETPTHWNENREFAGTTDLPEGGPYTSADDTVIRRHLEQAVEAGLDHLVVNLQATFQGLSPLELEATERIFDLIESEGSPLEVSILLAVSDDDPDVVERAIETIRREFMPRSCYQKIDEKPVIWYFLSDTFLGYFYQHHNDLVRLTEGCLAMATGGIVYSKTLPRLMRAFFRGWTPYSPLQAGPSGLRTTMLEDGYRDLAEDPDRVRTFTISPGYDDKHLESRSRKSGSCRSVRRREGKTYDEMQKVALGLSPPPQIVIVTSFNEFHENTHIEPSARYGDRYIRATARFRDRLRRSCAARTASVS